jgi:hypothetical protein
METPTHTHLKRVALDFLLVHGCPAAALEVACPISRYRIDVAGYLDKLPERRRKEEQAGPLPRGPAAATVFIECKASRADFLRDQRQLPALLRRREHLQRSLDRLRAELVKPMEPHLRRSDGFLFEEMESWDFCLSRLHSHRALVRALRQIDRKLYAETKFFMMAQYRLAARLYILAPRAMIHPRELPAGWGLLETDHRAPEIRVRHEAPAMTPTERHVVRTLRNIAAAATRDHRRAVVRRAITPGATVPGRDAVAVVPTPASHAPAPFTTP